MPCTNKTLAWWRETDAAAEALIIERLDSLACELATQTPRAPQPPPDWKRLATDIGEARAKVVRLVVSGVITEDDARKHLSELKRDEEALEARRAQHERQEANSTEETRRAAFAKLTEYREIWPRLSIADRRELAGELAESIRITTTGGIEIDWRPTAEVASTVTWSTLETPGLVREIHAA